MTVCASPGLSATPEQGGPPPPSAAGADTAGARSAACAITTDGAYAARLARSGDSWYPERWTLDGPEPYAVPLPGNQPEEPGTEVQPMGDGRVLIRRLVAGRHTFSLLYPTGPGTGELPLGAVECPEGTRLRLLPPAPGGERAYALAVGPHSTAVWLVAGGAFGPEHLAEVPGPCSGGAWLDRTGRLLALDRRVDGRTKTVVVDLEQGGAVSPLLQIAPHSDDRLLLADPDSGLLLIASDAPSPGEPRLGWGVLGSTLPVRFPECLRASDCAMTPFAIQPGQVLTPEHCAVALRCDGPFGSWIGVWRPTERRVRHLPAPEGWLTDTGVWTGDGQLRLPYVTDAVPCGVARWTPPAREPAAPRLTRVVQVAQGDHVPRLPAAEGAGPEGGVVPEGGVLPEGRVVPEGGALSEGGRVSAARPPYGPQPPSRPRRPYGPRAQGDDPGRAGTDTARRPAGPQTGVVFERVPQSASVVERAPGGAPRFERVPGSAPVFERVPGTTPVFERVPGSAPVFERVPGTTPVFERVPGSAPVFERVPGSAPVFERVPGTAPVFERVPGSAALFERVPESERPARPVPQSGSVPAVPEEGDRAPEADRTAEADTEAGPGATAAPRPVPLQQAALSGRMTGRVTGRMASG